MRRFNVTYEIVTPESAQHSDYAESGFVLAGGYQEELPSHVCGKPAGIIKRDSAMRLRAAIELMGLCEDSGSWYSEIDGRMNYRTGAETRYSLHCPDGISAASYARVGRLLGIDKRPATGYRRAVEMRF